MKFIYLDEVSGKEKKSSKKFFVFSDSLQNATKYVSSEIMNGHLVSISETKILDVFNFKPTFKVSVEEFGEII